MGIEIDPVKEYLDCKSKKLADLCRYVRGTYMKDAGLSRWATYGMQSVFVVNNRMAYQAEILLGVGITGWRVLSLWDNAELAYLLYFLIYGPLDKFDRIVWKIIGRAPSYTKKNLAMLSVYDTYCEFVYADGVCDILEEKLLNCDVDAVCRQTMQCAKYVVAKAGLNTYAAFAPEVDGLNLNLSITDCIETLCDANLEEYAKKFPKEMYGEIRYCLRRAEKLKDKLTIVSHSDPRVSIFGKGERMFNEVLSFNDKIGGVPYDIARMRRILV